MKYNDIQIMKLHKKTDYELRLFLEREIKELRESHALEISEKDAKIKSLEKVNNKLNSKLGEIFSKFNFKSYADTFNSIHNEYISLKVSGGLDVSLINRLNLQLNKLYESKSKTIKAFIKNNNLDEIS